MKFFSRLFFSFLVGLFVFLPASVQAQSSSTAEAEVLSDSPVVPMSPSFFASEQVTLRETYPGSVFVAGGQVNFSGETYGDLLIAGGSVFIDGVVNQDLYVGGGTVIISGEVLGNVVVAGGEIRFSPTAVVGGSVISAGESIQLDGTVQQQSFIFGRSIEFLGIFKSDVHVDAEEIRVKEGAVIQGFMTGESPQEVVVSDPAQVTRGVAVVVSEKTTHQSRDSLYWWLSKVAVTVVSFSIILIILTGLFGKQIARLSLEAVKEWQSSLLTGVVVFMSLSLGMFILFLTILGFKAGVIFFCLLLALGAIGWILPAFFFGQWIFPSQNFYVQALVGAVMVGVLISLPLVGWLFGVFLTVLGAGALFRSLRSE